MKLLPLLAAAFLLLPAASDAALQPAAPEPIWSLQLSLTDQGWPLRRQMLEALDPAMNRVPVAEFMQLLDRVELRAFPARTKKDNPLPVDVVVDMFLAKDFPERILERFKSRQGTWETIDGCAVQQIRGGDQGGEYWLAFPAERHFLIAPTRTAIETALRQPAEVPPTNEHGDLLTVRFDARQFRKAMMQSELLSALTSPVELRFATEGDRIRVTGETQLQDTRTAKRAKRIIDGMVAALAGELPPKVGESLDERLELTVTETKLGLKLEITSEEFKAWLDALKADLAEHVQVQVQPSAPSPQVKPQQPPTPQDE